MGLGDSPIAQAGLLNLAPMGRGGTFSPGRMKRSVLLWFGMKPAAMVSDSGEGTRPDF